MRTLMAILASMIVLGATAQTHLAIPAYPYAPSQQLWLTPSFYFNPGFVPFDQSARKWQIKPYASVSAGYIFLNGGISYLSTPVGFTFARPLNNNIAAYTNLSLAPTIFSMSSLYSAPAGLSPYSGAGYGLSTRIEGGLIYSNDARTFSISGGVSIERGSYQLFQPAAPHSAKTSPIFK
ncbi:MAG TPA: hypothetical protein VGQ51_16205 [Puia sp.]|jgi:hypothetical protein|nr:hypothetical protein [Puia sp.]